MLMQLHGQSAEIPSLRGQIEDALANLYAGRHQSARADLWYRKSIRTFEERRAAVKDEELRLPFFANGDMLYRDYAEFLIASQKQEKALQLLDIGRAKTLAEGLGSAQQKSGPQPENTVDPPGRLLASSMPPFCSIRLGRKNPTYGQLQRIARISSCFPGNQQLRPRSRDIRRPF